MKIFPKNMDGLNKRQDKDYNKLIRDNLEYKQDLANTMGTEEYQKTFQEFQASILKFSIENKKEILKLATVANGKNTLEIFFKLVFIPFLAMLTTTEILEFFKAMNWEWADVFPSVVGTVSMGVTMLWLKLNENRAWQKLFDTYKIYA